MIVDVEAVLLTKVFQALRVLSVRVIEVVTRELDVNMVAGFPFEQSSMNLKKLLNKTR